MRCSFSPPLSWSSLPAGRDFAGCSSAVTSPLPTGWHTGLCTEGKVSLWYLFQPLVSHHSPFLAVSYTWILWVGVLTSVVMCWHMFYRLHSMAGVGRELWGNFTWSRFHRIMSRQVLDISRGDSTASLANLFQYFVTCKDIFPHSHMELPVLHFVPCPFSCWWAPLRRFWSNPLDTCPSRNMFSLSPHPYGKEASIHEDPRFWTWSWQMHL